MAERVEKQEAEPLVGEKALFDYFREVIVPFAGIQVGQFVERPPEWLKAEEWDLATHCKNSLMQAELTYKYCETSALDLKDGLRPLSYFDMVARTATAAKETDIRPAQRAANKWWKIGVTRLLGKLEDGEDGEESKQLRNGILSYRWLLNDIRRAWHAARVFLSEIEGPLSVVEAHAAGKDPVAVSRAPLSRDHRYTLVSRSSLDRWLGRVGERRELGELIERWSERSAALAGLFTEGIHKHLRKGKKDWEFSEFSRESAKKLREEYLSQELRNVILSSNPAEKVKARIADAGSKVPLDLDVVQVLLNARASGDSPVTWPLIIDPGEESPGKDKGGERGCTPMTAPPMQGRIARSYWAFIGAIGPCLPAAMHMEVASIWRVEGVGRKDATKKIKSNTKHILDDWENRIERFLVFLFRYRALLEVSKLRQDMHDFISYPPEDAGLDAKQVKELAEVRGSVEGVLFWWDICSASSRFLILDTWGRRGDQLRPNGNWPTEKYI